MRIVRYFGQEYACVSVLKKCGLVQNADFTVQNNGDLDLRICITQEMPNSRFTDVCEALDVGLYADEDKSLQAVLVDFLLKNDLKISTAESCTGGMLASALVDVSGASKVFSEGLVTYSNEAKILRLNVPENDIEEYNAVSAKVACDMAYGLITGGAETDIGVSTTGLAGPGDCKHKEKIIPCGTVYVGIADREHAPISYEFRLAGDRNTVRKKATNAALFYTLKYLQHTY